jgi:hypothetical protein
MDGCYAEQDRRGNAYADMVIHISHSFACRRERYRSLGHRCLLSLPIIACALS